MEAASPSEAIHLFACDLVPIEEQMLRGEMETLFQLCDEIRYLRMFSVGLKVRDA